MPDTIQSDNSPFNSAEFCQFASKNEFEHITSSPNYPILNEKVENTVRAVMNLIKKKFVKSWTDGKNSDNTINKNSHNNSNNSLS